MKDQQRKKKVALEVKFESNINGRISWPGGIGLATVEGTLGKQPGESACKEKDEDAPGPRESDGCWQQKNLTLKKLSDILQH